MTDVKQRIEKAKAALRRAEQQKTVAETQKATAEEQLAEVKAAMLEEGVTPETIDMEIAAAEEQLLADISKVERLIPQDI